MQSSLGFLPRGISFLSCGQAFSCPGAAWGSQRPPWFYPRLPSGGLKQLPVNIFVAQIRWWRHPPYQAPGRCIPPGISTHTQSRCVYGQR